MEVEMLKSNDVTGHIAAFRMRDDSYIGLV